MRNVVALITVTATLMIAGTPVVMAQAGSQTYTLSAGTYTYVGPGQPVGCPQCKDLFYTMLHSPAGTKITKVEILDRRPHVNNHWYRCQAEVDCGVQEFSDVNQHSQSCIGTSACVVWRATDSRGNQEDDVRITWQ
jgi:hypothetical protein